MSKESSKLFEFTREATCSENTSRAFKALKLTKNSVQRQVNHYCELRPESELAKIKARGFRLQTKCIFSA